MALGTYPDYSCFAPQHLLPDWRSRWRHFYEELLVKIDGSQAVHLAHHRSRSAEHDWAQSRISRDGRYLIFDSNMDLQSKGLNNYADVYMIKVR